MDVPLHHRATGNSFRIAFLSLIIICALFVSALFADAEATTARHKATCVDSQQLYDGDFVLVSYIAKELHATEAQTQSALKDLARTLKKRPVC